MLISTDYENIINHYANLRGMRHRDKPYSLANELNIPVELAIAILNMQETIDDLKLEISQLDDIIFRLEKE